MATTDEFQGWLSKGLGRAVLHLKNHDADPHLETLLNACIHNVAYDRQCESERDEYLKDLIRASGQEAFIRDGLLRALSASEIDTNEVDLRQMVAVARMFAERGDSAVKRAMYEAVSNVGFEQGCDCYTDLVALDGMVAFRFASEHFPAEPDGFQLWLMDELLAALETRDGEAEARQVVLKASRNSVKLKKFADRIGKSEPRQPFVDTMSGLDYPSLKSLIQSDTKMRQLSGWGQVASTSDLKAVAEDIAIESNHNRLFSYLSIFRKAKFPSSIDRLLELAESDVIRLAQASVGILSKIADPRIKELIVRWMNSGDHLGNAVELMTGNLIDGDFARIEQMLRNTQDVDVVHSIGMGLRHLVKTHTVPESINCLIYIYENGPCSLCRGEVVEFLIALNEVPAWMREECKFDADPDTRKLVSA